MLTSLAAPQRTTPVRVAGTWAKRTGLAIVDQALLAGAHFVVGVLLARWLSPQEYGAFALGYSMLLLVGALQIGGLTEPLAVYGSGKYVSRFPEYLGVLIRMYVSWVGSAALILLAGGVLAGHYFAAPVRAALLGSVLTMPTVPLFWLARQALYVHSMVARAAVGSGTYFVLTVGIVTILHLAALLSASTAFLGMAVGAGVVAVLQLMHTGLTWKSAGSLEPKLVLLDHWAYAKWAVVATIITWVPWNAHFLILPMLIPLEQVAELRALFNVFSPLSHLLVALTTLLLPVISRQYHNSGWPAIRTLVAPLVVAYGVPSLIYAGLMLLEGPRLLYFLYGGTYVVTYRLSTMVGLVQVPISIMMVFALLYRAMGRTRDVAFLFAPYAIVALLLGVAGASLLGLSGALAGFAVAAWVALGFSLVRFLRTARALARPVPSSV